MSLYWETADLLTAPTNAGGSLKSRIFGKKDLKSQPAQIYALAIETCKWSSVLKEVVENADILRVERKLTPILSILLTHDLLLAKKGVALPATHGLRVAIERHKNRLQAEFTRARIRRKLGSAEAFKAFIESGLEDRGDGSEMLHPRWIRINTLKTTLEDQLETTFSGYERSTNVDDVRHRGSKRLFIDFHIPNLIAISPNIDLSKSDAYKNGSIIFQDKASCFPAYLLDPLAEDGDIIDTCAAPGNKTTHIAAILLSHNSEPDKCSQVIHAFEKNKGRAVTLEKMVNLAGSDAWTKLHPGQDFLKTDPNSAVFKNVGALLLDPSCSGSGIIGRDDMPELHLPVIKQPSSNTSKPQKKGSKTLDPSNETRKRKREDHEDALDVMVDDDGEVTAVNSEDELKARIEALSKFQLELLLHAFKFPTAKKITYSTCSIHAGENEMVVQKALEHPVAKERGWRVLKRENQIRGMQEWPVRGSLEACRGDEILAEACIRANKEDEHCTMGFFLAGFTRDLAPKEDIDSEFLRDERGHLVRDIMGFPVRVDPGAGSANAVNEEDDIATISPIPADEGEEEWSGFGDDGVGQDNSAPLAQEFPKKDKRSGAGTRHDPSKKRPQFGITDKKRKKSKKV
ncbi:S-adenosyl-L-methionine-dependent methyltransferase [Hyaloscypha variabilis F]|uniref:S-adenosyl-L-methionine-dependent methyltransferase n=1 Tax=Hyaloscypha variabilis (strain UAMH 11265 / GT02V1 / F) TaxID=1149755 RepID=A0A2J6RDC4_HYAVF|nr:S-adenosyl-L-methionine-dependent methyltransferase [Hyaloscypha variabilis F]